MLTGQQAKHPFVQPADVTFIRAEVVDRRERRRGYIRARAMMKREQMESDGPVRKYERVVQTFNEGDFVRMKVEGSAVTPLLGRPKKWTQRWVEKGTVIGPVEGHPVQFWVRRSTTGRVVNGSATSLVLARDKPPDGC